MTFTASDISGATLDGALVLQITYGQVLVGYARYTAEGAWETVDYGYLVTAGPLFGTLASDGAVVYRDGAYPGIDVERAKAEVEARTKRIIAEV